MKATQAGTPASRFTSPIYTRWDYGSTGKCLGCVVGLARASGRVPGRPARHHFIPTQPQIPSQMRQQWVGGRRVGRQCSSKLRQFAAGSGFQRCQCGIAGSVARCVGRGRNIGHRQGRETRLEVDLNEHPRPKPGMRVLLAGSEQLDGAGAHGLLRDGLVRRALPFLAHFAQAGAQALKGLYQVAVEDAAAAV